jgi:transposase-like protein
VREYGPSGALRGTVARRMGRRRYGANEKLAFVEATMQPGMTVSAVARMNGVSRELAYLLSRSLVV